MADPPPKAWLCKHCGERVDPTMGMCWRCGHDRNGEPALDLQPVIDAEMRVRLGRVTNFTHSIQNWSVLLRLVFASWCVTGLFVMITGTGPFRRTYGASRGPVDELVVTLFHVSVLFTLLLIAHRLVYNGQTVNSDEPMLTSELHRPWIRRWMLRGWGSVLFWFAWGWVLLNYFP
jgi:hypothetical protein